MSDTAAAVVRQEPRRAAALRWYVRTLGGGDWPFLVQERRYLASKVPAGAVVADVGGGEGRLANWLARSAGRVVIVDRETTSLPGADASRFAGSLRRAMQGRSNNVYVVRGDATTLPFAAASLDAIVSSQLLEHLPAAQRDAFFRESARALKVGGVLAISTPNGDYMARRHFWVPALARTIVPPAWIPKLPRSLRGPWLEHGVAGWEKSVGHYDHGCRLAQVRSASAAEGFEELDTRYLHTRLTSFWFQLVSTLPAVYLLALPLVRLLYAIEGAMPGRDGINLMMTFRKRA